MATPPATLPADFKFEDTAAPETLPADFNFSAPAKPPKTLPADHFEKQPAAKGPTIEAVPEAKSHGPGIVGYLAGEVLSPAFRGRVREAVAGPDTALGSIDGNKTKNIINLQDTIAPGDEPLRNAARGVLAGASGFTTPGNVVTAPALGALGVFGKAAPLVSRLVGAGFALQGVKNLWDIAPEFKEAVQKKDYDKAAEIAGEMLVTGAVVAGAGHGALKRAPKTLPKEFFEETPASPGRISHPEPAPTESPKPAPEPVPVQKPAPPAPTPEPPPVEAPKDEPAGQAPPPETDVSAGNGTQTETPQPREEAQPTPSPVEPPAEPQKSPSTFGKETNIPVPGESEASATDSKAAPEELPEKFFTPEAEQERAPLQDGSTTPRSVALNSLLGGLHEGVETFGREDILPAAKEAGRNVKDAADDILRAFAPAVRGEGGPEAASAMRAAGGKTARAYDRAEAALRDAKKIFQSRKPAENYEFIDRVESGTAQPNSDDQKVASVLRNLLDERRKQVQKLGKAKLEAFYKDYFPHIWKDPTKAGDAFRSIFAKKPLEGPKSFLKRRTHLTFKDGLAAGLEPVSDNPVDLALLKAREMDRYIMAHQTLADLKAKGMAKFSRSGPPGPGWRKIDDPIGAVYSRNEKGETILRGNYWAPDGAAQVINNHLSPGLRSKGWYRTLLGANNTLNQFQLGMSAFHLGFTSADAAVSRAALGFEQVLRGRPLKGLKTLASTAAAPFTTAVKGHRLLREWYKPGAPGSEVGAIADELMHAGGRVRMDEMYHTRAVEGFVQAWRQGNVIGAALRLPFAAVDAVSRPIMDYLVPRQKLGVFADMARFEMEEYNHKLQQVATDPYLSKSEKAERTGSEQKAMRENMRKAWDSVENRMGQMTYDNLFWNKTAKDLAMLGTRSVGWNLGTLREIGGGIGDAVKQPLNAKAGKPVNLKRITYLMGLVTVGATTGAMYQYLRTGQGPQELKDYFFPKTGELDANGRPQRVELPLYIKDVYRYSTDPKRTITGKASPLVDLVSEMVRNEDFYGTEIANSNDPFVRQLIDRTKFVGEQALPFGVRNYEKQSQEGQSLLTKAQNFVGITPAPSSVDQTAAEQLASQYIRRHIPAGGRTKDQADTKDTEKQLTQKAKKDPDAAIDEARQDVESGKLTQRQAIDSLKSSNLTPLQKTFRHLSLDEAIRVYEVSSEGERRQLKDKLYDKAERAYKVMNADKQKQLLDRIRPLKLAE